MSRSHFETETGRLDFTLDTTWKLFRPAGREAPAGGWPLVVALHGMGMTSDQFALVLNDLLDPEAAYLFPQAVYPYEIRREGTIRIGYAWYLYDGHEEPFRSTLAASEAHLLKLIDEVGRRIPINPGKVFLLGFSMGAYLAFFVALRNPDRFSGLVAIGGRMKEEFLLDRLPGARGLPILMVHGEKDRAVPLERAQSTHETLKRHGFTVELRLFPVGHEIRAVEVEAVKEWLSKRLRGEAP